MVESLPRSSIISPHGQTKTWGLGQVERRGHRQNRSPSTAAWASLAQQQWHHFVANFTFQPPWPNTFKMQRQPWLTILHDGESAQDLSMKETDMGVVTEVIGDEERGPWRRKGQPPTKSWAGCRQSAQLPMARWRLEFQAEASEGKDSLLPFAEVKESLEG